jgi:phosphoribosylanthranilate isomerase
MNVKVKVCGITSLADAEKSLELGADMLGFNFYPPSPRFLTPQKAREIIEQLPWGSFNVALFVNEPRKNVFDVIAPDRLGNGRSKYLALQFHGEENAQ